MALKKQEALAAAVEQHMCSVQDMVAWKAQEERSATEPLREEMSELRQQVVMLKGSYGEVGDELEMMQVQIDLQV